MERVRNNEMKAFIFDLDGTLLNTIEDITDSVNYILTKYAYEPLPVETVNQYVGNGLRRLLIRCVPEGEDNVDFEQMYKEFVPYYAEHSLIKTRPYEGILPLLEELKKRGIEMAIVTNKNVTAAKRLNEQLFQQYIPVIIGEDEAHGVHKKPNPDMVFAAMKELHVTQEDAVYIGDSEVDVATALNVGLPCVSVAWGFRTRQQQMEAGATVFAKKPGDLLQFINKTPADFQ